jgi:Cutinase
MFTSTRLLTLMVLGASALPATPISQREYNSFIERDNWSVTRNDLVDGACQPVTIIFARGTLELGNVGSLAGPPFFNALTDMIGDDVAVQGVDYAADILGYLEGGDPAGASTMASLIEQAVSQCPSTQIVISGYRYAVSLLSISLILTPI